MPCDTISTVNVKFDQKSTDLNLLVAALNAQDANANARVQGNGIAFSGGTYNASTGEFTFTSSYYNKVSPAQAQKKVAALKQSYGAEVVKSQAKRFGWQLKEIAPFQYEVMKR